MKKLIAMVIVLVMSMSMAVTGMAEESPAPEGTEWEDVFADWVPEAPALNYLIDYVEAVTDESSDEFIPIRDRIAVFDMDGTLYGELFPTYLEYYLLAWRILEDPSFEPDEELLALGRELRDSALDHSFAEDMPMRHALGAAKAYAGLTLPEFAAFVNERLLHDVDGFQGMTYGEAFYQPMLEVIEYLQDNEFTVYVVSGSDRFICRTLLEGVVDIPYANIIGMDVAMEATHQGDTDGLDYVFQPEDEVVRTDRLVIKNLKMNKVLQILTDIGQQPVLSFGNSSGDVSMHNFTISNNPYKSAAFMLIADDEERDYGNTEKTRKLGEQWAESGYQVVSMRDDFRTIYGDDVVKTGSFHWAEELAEDRVPADAAAADEAAADDNTQYMLCLGTIDRDTNEPVYGPEEAKEKVKEILVRYFDGYTMYEAEGGWTSDDGTAHQETTLIIYPSETSSDQIYAAADEMLSTFHQSSVLIQENQAQMEFYTGEKQ